MLCWFILIFFFPILIYGIRLKQCKRNSLHCTTQCWQVECRDYDSSIIPANRWMACKGSWETPRFASANGRRIEYRDPTNRGRWQNECWLVLPTQTRGRVQEARPEKESFGDKWGDISFVGVRETCKLAMEMSFLIIVLHCATGS